MFKNVKPKWYIGICAFVLTITFFIFAAFPLQLKFGMWGLAITQLGILFIALIPVFLFRWKISDVMPMKKVTAKQLFAMLLLYIATFFIVNTVTITTTYLFPESVQLSMDIADFFTTAPFLASLIIISVITGICEEVLHRGVIQYTFKDCKSELAIMLFMAVIFGAFHLSLFRFLPTAIIGFVLAYLMIKTKNFLIPVLYHAVHNAVGFVISYGADSNPTVSMPLESIGVFLILSSLSPFLFYTGVKLLNKEKPSKRTKYATIALTLVLPILGIGIFALSHSQTETYVTNFSMTPSVNIETPPEVVKFTIEKEGTYNIFVSIKDETHTVTTGVRIEHEDGEIAWDVGGIDLFANRFTNLKIGVYNVIFTFETQSEQKTPVDISFSIE
ncbi:MAG: CPBP family intramembrane metalloprotease [Lachnospiraceae bacterium]|jgi:membrane protease YdiL (CAAX protease family)|nr:CPBP family intramembrane metalloprotease [Lachnospiraceae bacterium]